MVDLEINKTYLVHNGYFPTFNKEYYEALIPMIYTHTTHRMDDGERFFFKNPLDDKMFVSIHKSSLKNDVFTDKNDFLKYSVYESNRISNKMDEYFLGLVEKSREEQPQKWI